MENIAYPPDSQHARAYMRLRRQVGWMGILLPVVLVAGNALIFGGSVLPSISHYYHSGMRDVLVGGLCSMGMFLFHYNGYDQWENWVGNAGGAFAIGVALFPTVEQGPLGTVGLVHCAGALGLEIVGLWAFGVSWFVEGRELTGRTSGMANALAE